MDDEDFLPFSFLGITAKPLDPTTWITLLPVGYEATVSYRSGTREGPAAIINASRFIEEYDLELGADFSGIGIATLPSLQPQVSSPEAMITRISRTVEHLLAHHKRVALLGGEHTVTLGALGPLDDLYPHLNVLQIDAHLDLRDEYEGSAYSHACVMRRAWEMCPVVAVGIRSGSQAEADFVKSQDLHPFFAWDIVGRQNWINEVVAALSEHVYITVDLDGLDPGIMPAVGTPEPGGLGWYELTSLLQCVADNRTIVGFDVVELCPQPANIAPDVLASRLVYRLVALTYLSQQRTKA